MMELTKYSTHEGWSASSRVYSSRESIKEIIQNETVKNTFGQRCTNNSLNKIRFGF